MADFNFVVKNGLLVSNTLTVNSTAFYWNGTQFLTQTNYTGTANSATNLNGKAEGALNVNSASTALTANNSTNLGGKTEGNLNVNNATNFAGSAANLFVKYADSGGVFTGTFTYNNVLTANAGIRARGGTTGGSHGYSFSGSGDSDGGLFSDADGEIKIRANNGDVAVFTPNNVTIPGSLNTSRIDSSIKTGDYTLQASDSGKTITCDSGSTITITVPSLQNGFRCLVVRIGSGAVNLVQSGLTSFVSRTGSMSVTQQYGSVSVFFWDSAKAVIDGSI